MRRGVVVVVGWGDGGGRTFCVWRFGFGVLTAQGSTRAPVPRAIMLGAPLFVPCN